MMNHKHMSITTMSPTEAMCTLVTCLSESKDEDLCVAVLRHRLQDRGTMALKGSWGPCVSKNSSVEEEGKSEESQGLEGSAARYRTLSQISALSSPSSSNTSMTF